MYDKVVSRRVAQFGCCSGHLKSGAGAGAAGSGAGRRGEYQGEREQQQQPGARRPARRDDAPVGGSRGGGGYGEDEWGGRGGGGGGGYGDEYGQQQPEARRPARRDDAPVGGSRGGGGGYGGGSSRDDAPVGGRGARNEDAAVGGRGQYDSSGLDEYNAPPPPARRGPRRDDEAAVASAAPPRDAPARQDVGQLVECRSCGRKFAEDRLAKHEKVCEKVFVQKRKAFDVKAMRAEGTDNAKYVREQQLQEKRAAKMDGRGGASAKPSSFDDRPAVGAAGKKPKWKAESEQFRAAMKAAKQITEAQKAGIDIRTLKIDTGGYEEQDDRVPCPHCGRKFAAITAGEKIFF